MKAIRNKLAAAANQTEAIESYSKHFDECSQLIERLEKGINDHAKRAINNPKNWGYAGDLGGLKETLRQAVFSVGAMSNEEAEKYGI